MEIYIGTVKKEGKRLEPGPLDLESSAQNNLC